MITRSVKALFGNKFYRENANFTLAPKMAATPQSKY